ncbi:hypothetical protein JCM10207_006820 [Rhodosporidiobolus poonsookiae]
MATYVRHSATPSDSHSSSSHISHAPPPPPSSRLPPQLRASPASGASLPPPGLPAAAPAAAAAAGAGPSGFSSYSAPSTSGNAFTTAAATGGQPAFAPVAGPSASPSASTSHATTDPRRRPAPVASTSASALAGPSPSAAGPSGSASAAVIDLTSSSPPSSHRRLVPALRASGLAYPGAPPSASTSNAAAGPSRNTRASAAARRTRFSEGGALVLGSDDEDEIEYRAVPRGASTGATPTGALLMDDSDSDIEIVSERPAQGTPDRPLYRHSPPPFILPTSNYTRTSASSSRGNPQTRSRARFPRSESDTTAARVAADAAHARRLAEQFEREDAAAAAATRAPPHGVRGGRRGFGGIFSPGAGGAGDDLDGGAGGLGAGLRDTLQYLSGGNDYVFAVMGGGFWSGAMHGGGAGPGLYGLYGGGVGPANTGGWGGAAKVKAASKKYGVRMSHPAPVEKGFRREIVEPPEEGAAPPPAKKAKKGKGKAVAEPAEEEVPVCASCLDALFLGGEGTRKVFALKCGHVVCAGCLDAAKERARDELAAAGAAKAKARGKQPASAAAAKGKSKGKGKAPRRRFGRADDDDFHLTSSDDELDDADAPDSFDASFDSDSYSGDDPFARSRAAPSKPEPKKDKGKARSRADETGVEERWTACPVASCDGRGGDVLAEIGWARPFEVFV